ncbi:MAG: hypothetical protein HY707_03035 [Ignavibacteriae bacterium]|nr:hypothetical protein [Ignavibacteriota bacterium]
MPRMGNVRIKGFSGKMYTFRAYPLDTKFKDFGAVYFITSRNHDPDGRISHSRIYCGQTSDLSTRTDDPRIAECLKTNNANCICILLEADESARIQIESDIRQNYKLLFNA